MSGSPLSIPLVFATLLLSPAAQGAEHLKINTQTTPRAFAVDVDQRQCCQKQLRFAARRTIRRAGFGVVSPQRLIAAVVRIIVMTETEVG